MKNRAWQVGGIALTMLAWGCSGANEQQAGGTPWGFQEQLAAALPLVDQGFVLKACNTNDRPGDHGSLSFSLVAEKADPADPGKTIPTDPLPLEKQLAAILPLVDGDHSLNIRQEIDGATGQPQFVFTIHRNRGTGTAMDAGPRS